MIKKILLILIILKATYCNSQTLHLTIPEIAGEEINIHGFDKLKTLNLQTIILDSSGNATTTLDYKGIIYIVLPGKQEFPVIIKEKHITFTLHSIDSLPLFTDKENIFFYTNLIKKQLLLQKTYTLTTNIQYFDESDPYHKVLSEKLNKIEEENLALKKLMQENPNYIGSVMIRSKYLMERSSYIKTLPELNALKLEFINFILKNFKALQHSNMLIHIMGQYVMMNEYVIVGQDNHFKQVITDIEELSDKLKKKFTPSEIINYYIEYYLNRYMAGLSGMIAAEYQDYAACKSSLPDNNIISDTLPDFEIKFSGNNNITTKLSEIGPVEKILYFFNSSCAACYSQQVLLMRNLHELTQNIPVITIFSDGNANNSIQFISNLHNNPYLYSEDNTLYKTSGIKQFPAFIVMSKNNLITERFYSYNNLMDYIKNKKN